MPTPPKDRVPRGKGSQVKRVNKGQRNEQRVQGRMAQFMHGEITVEDLDDEELLQGRVRDREGMFRGRPPKLIPREFHEAITRELLSRGERIIREHYLKAIDTFVKIAADPNVEPKDRLKAAQYVWERMAGKLPDKVEVKAKVEPWQEDISAIITKEPGEQQ